MAAAMEPRDATAFTKFRLLMWKNFLQQWRRPIQTAFELLLPVITVCLVLILRWQVEAHNHQEALIYPPLPAHTLRYSTLILLQMIDRENLTETEISVAYSPASTELEDVVRSAFARMITRNIIDNKDELLPVLTELLGIPDIEIPPDILMDPRQLYAVVKRFVKVREFNSSYDMRGLYADEKNTLKVIAAVEFDDLLYGTNELPNNISYSLRFPERPRMNSFLGHGSSSWRTNLVFPAFELHGPRSPYSWEGGRDPGYVNEMFIALQHSVSSEIISRITGEDLTQLDINIQRYPHPPYVEDVAVELLQFMFPIFFTFAFSYTAINIVRAVTVEKELQLKETMKIMGLPTWLHWTAWFCKQFIYLLISSVLIVILLKVKWFSTEDGFSGYSVFTNTPWTVLLFFINIYFICVICFCFMISGIFSSAGTAALFAGIVWFLSNVPATLVTMENEEVSIALQTFTCLSINSAMTYGFQLLFAQEGSGGVQWSSFFTSPSTDSSRFLFGHVVLMLILDSIIYMLIALYLEQVRPGPFGTPKRWNFLFTKDFWISDTNKYGDLFEIDKDPNNLLMESDPVGLEIGVHINNLTKAYGNNIVVNHLSMNIYNDQITVLLGHNGAGKSTTISMLTGNLEATAGSVSVAGYDIRSQTRAARAHLGLCLQHNVLFHELTVREHLEFFARLKGFHGQQLNDDIDSLIEKLELQEKRDYQSQGLSGGQKRRLCVGIALSGGAKVVLLDEPTSGMDPASRRGLWDLLQKEKKGRAMILTTHFMDEADFLGDRVAIMAHGRLQCVGSPQFLKRHHGLSYQLVVVKDHCFDFDRCSELIGKYIPDFTIKDDRGLEIIFSLLSEHSHLFEAMLEDLENNVATIKFKNYGLIATSLEDVFMSIGADLALVDSTSDDGNTTTSIASEVDSIDQLHSKNSFKKEVTGFLLILQHVRAMWLKLWLYWTRSWGTVLLQLTVPVVLINITLITIRVITSVTDNVVSRNLTLTEGFAQTETLLAFNGSSLDSLGARALLAYESMFDSSGVNTMLTTIVQDQRLDEYYLERAQASERAMSAMRHTVLTGATFSERAATAWFSNFGYHDVAVSLAAVHSAILKAFDSTAQLHVYNYPLQANYARQNNVQSLLTLMSVQLANGIGTSLAIVSAVFIMFYIKEKASGAKLLQKAAGLQPATMWLSAAVFDWLWFLIIGLTVIASCAAFSVAGLSTPAELGRLYLCIVVFGAAMLPLNYLLSHLFNGPPVGFVAVFFLSALFGMMGSQIVAALASPTLTTQDIANVMDFILQFYPMYSFVSAIRKLNEGALAVQTCLQICESTASLTPGLDCDMQAACELIPTLCCIREGAHLAWEEPGILRYLVVMIACGIFCWILLMVIEYRLLHRLLTRKRTPPAQAVASEPDVAREEQFVSAAGLGQHGLVARKLSKYYGKHLAVDQVSFSVSDSECFGLLGVNGAGKTTTFKMLMGDETISSGEAFVSGYSVEKQLTKVHDNIGYCPQFDALFGELTGRETLRLFSLLRGLRAHVADQQAAALAVQLGFHPHLDKRISDYSGGTKRKLSTAVAFLGDTRLVFVDEPTTGVDPAAKRHVWRAVRSVQRAGRGVLLTSHSMEECEALCSRLAIMVNGRFQCLGTPQHLKNKFSEGYTLTIKLKLDHESCSASNSPATDAVKNFVSSNFVNPKIMEEHRGVLTYYLPVFNLPWSKMFGTMERAKRDLEIEYYNISQTALEQIFLQFTKYQTLVS